MSTTVITKTYKPAVVDGVFTAITYDMPIHWVIRVENSKQVDIYRAGKDDSVKLADVQTWFTISPRGSNLLLPLLYIMPLNETSYKWSLIISSTIYDSITVKMNIKNQDYKSPNIAYDRVLVLQGTKFYVDSAYLSIWSKYFERLFNSGFMEKEANEIKIEEVDPTEFDELLNVIGPNKKEITGINVSFIWKLADRFDIPTIAAQCEQYLLTSPGAYSMQLWDKYNLAIAMKSEKLEKQCRSVMEKIPIGK